MRIPLLPLTIVLVVLAGLVLLMSQPETRLAPVWAIAAGAAADTAAEPASNLSGVAELQPTAAAPTFTIAEGNRPYVPILMYHYVRYVDKGSDPLGFSLSVTPEQLTAQLDWLQRNGYETVRMDVVGACIGGAGPCPARAVALTFDDGYMDAYTTALPLLQRYGFTATFYIVSDFVGRPGYMGWNELAALRDAGMEIGAHSVSHPDLTTLDLNGLRDQVGRSRDVLAANLGIPIVSFCYPGGKFNDTVAAVTQESGFLSATTTMQEGPQNDLFRLPRLRIYGDMSQPGFEASIRAYMP
ncbi:MAG: polysaccharide deacetylase family protein [Oscillochloris sp.]|nr:polysaccharide deacetylase family protein [Oscillochloris sp.]